MTDRQRLVLALGITEFDGAIDHLRAHRWHGVTTANQITDLEARLLRLILMWAPGAHLTETLAEARQYLTDNIDALEALLDEIGEEARA